MTTETYHVALPRNFDADFILSKQVVNPNPIDNDLAFTEDGIFSSEIFGNLGNGRDFSCSCGTTQGEFNIGTVCPECNSEVKFRGLAISTEGWIDMVYPIIHPVFFQYIKKLIGLTVLNKIITFNSRIVVTGKLASADAPLEYPFHGIGIIEFIENFDQIIGEFFSRKKVTPQREKDYAFLMEHRELIFCSKIPVINSKLRPAIVINNEFSFDEINNFYNAIVKNSQMLNEMTGIDGNIHNIQSLMLKNQVLVNGLFEKTVSNIGSKEGYVRASLLGNRCNFTARAVITPLGGDYAMDEIVIPYFTAVELLKPLIISKLKLLKKVNLIEANRLWYRASTNFDNFVYKVMCDIIQDTDSIRVLLNRNPTISVGSIICLKIAGIKKDVDDKTLSIHNLLLALLAGDYDGDVLNLLMVFTKSFVNIFKKFEPHNFIIDCDNGEFNSAFKPAKDIALGLRTLNLSN